MIALRLAIIILIIVVIIVILVVTSKPKDKEEMEKYEAAKAQKYQEALAKQEAREKKKEADKQELIALYGEPSRVILFNNEIKESLIAFNNSQTLYYNGKTFPYNTIYGVEVRDNSYTSNSGSSETISKTKTGSMLGRAAIGAVVAGPVGAVIGGATAKKETITTNDPSTTIHHYKVVISFNDASTPPLYLECGGLWEKACKIEAMITKILNDSTIQPQASITNQKSVSIADELEKFARLRDQGIITEQEFIDQKAKLLSK